MLICGGVDGERNCGEDGGVESTLGDGGCSVRGDGNAGRDGGIASRVGGDAGRRGGDTSCLGIRAGVVMANVIGMDGRGGGDDAGVIGRGEEDGSVGVSVVSGIIGGSEDDLLGGRVRDGGRGD